MKQRSAIMAGAIALALSGSAVLAQSEHEHDDKTKPDEASMVRGSDDMMKMHRMMMKMHNGMMDGDMMGHGMMNHRNVHMARVFHGHFDTDEDGKVSPQEARTTLEGWLKESDANGDGTLNIAEFEALHSRLTRETMVDRFQHLDADGDGQVTHDEMTAPAKMMERMQKMPGMMKSGDNDMRSNHKKGMSDSN